MITVRLKLQKGKLLKDFKNHQLHRLEEVTYKTELPYLPAIGSKLMLNERGAEEIAVHLDENSVLVATYVTVSEIALVEFEDSCGNREWVTVIELR